MSSRKTKPGDRRPDSGSESGYDVTSPHASEVAEAGLAGNTFGATAPTEINTGETGPSADALEVNVREARLRFRELLDRAAAGQETTILRRGRPVARLVPPQPQDTGGLPAMQPFRDQLRVQGPPLSEALVAAREEERY